MLFYYHLTELEESLVWVYFDSHIEEFNCVECWGPLREAAIKASKPIGSKRKELHHDLVDG